MDQQCLKTSILIQVLTMPIRCKYYTGQHQIEQSTHATLFGSYNWQALKNGLIMFIYLYVDKIGAKVNAKIGLLKRNFSSCNLTVEKIVT